MGYKGNAMLSHTLLKKGFKVPNFCQSLHKRIISLLCFFHLFFKFLFIHMKMKCHIFQLTWRLRHKEIRVKKEIKEYRNCLACHTHVILLLQFYIEELQCKNNCCFHLFLTHKEGKQKQNTN